MNIQYLKYALEVARNQSLNKAAQRLFIAQPNLSRAIKELEESLGITIFERTHQGMRTTPDGETFLQYAANLIRQIDEVEKIYTQGRRKKHIFSVSAPRTSYISYAFSQFAAKVEQDAPMELFYKETNALRAINNILHEDYKLGIIRYAKNHAKYFAQMLKEKGLAHEVITEFTYVLIMSRAHPLAQKAEILFDDLAPYTEIAHADPFVPSLSVAAVRKEELPDNVDKRIFVFERASQFDLLEETPGTFMWISPLSNRMLDKFGLVQRTCKDNRRQYRDVLIYREDYRLTELDKLFIQEVYKARQRVK